MNNLSPNFASAIVYVHNNADVLPQFIGGLSAELKQIFLHSEIIVVDDNSTDDSKAVVEAFAQTQAQDGSQSVTLLEMSGTQGEERSMQAGVDLSIGDYVFEFDSTLQDYEWDTILEIYAHSQSRGGMT